MLKGKRIILSVHVQMRVYGMNSVDLSFRAQTRVYGINIVQK